MYRIGFDIGGTNLKVGAVNEKNQIVAKNSIAFKRDSGCESIAKVMAGQVDILAQEIGIKPSEFKSMGIATAGSVNTVKGVIINAHNLGFNNVPMSAEMSKYFPYMHIKLVNDADAAALGELHVGALVGKKTAILLTLGTGVGGGIIIDGRLFKGGQGRGSELGHMAIQHGGLLCSCGNRGCIETLCAATWLISQGRKSVVENPLSLIYEKVQGDMEKVTAKVVIDSAKEGDSLAKDIFNTYLESLSSAIVSIVNLLDPEVVAIGGGVSLAGDFLFGPLRKLVNEKSFFKVSYEIMPAMLGNDAGIIGAAMFL